MASLSYTALMLQETLELNPAGQPTEVPDFGPIHQALFASALIFLACGQFPLQRWLRREVLDEDGSPEPAPGPRFAWVDLFAVVLMFLVANQLLFMALESRYPDKGPQEIFDSLGAVGALALTAAGFASPCLYLLSAAFRHPGGLQALGVRGLTRGYRLVYAGITYAAGLPLFMGLALLSALLFELSGRESPQQEVAVLIRDGLASAPIPILLLSVVVVPLLEEILFRGFLLELLASRLGVVAGVLLSSVAFAVLHGEEAALPIFGLAIILGLVKVRTRSLGAAWFVHALHNGGTTFLLWMSTLIPQ